MGNRVVMLLGWKGEQILEKAEELLVHLDAKKPDTFYKVDADEINEQLIHIQREILQTHLEFVIENEYEENDYGLSSEYYFQVKAPHSPVELKGMRLITTGELYEEDLSEIAFGVELSGFFTPVLLDWDATVLGEGVFSFTVTNEKYALFQCIKEKVVKRYPIFEDAEWLFEME